MGEQDVPVAWIALISEEEVRARRGPGGGRLALPTVANMGRLLQTHPRIGPAFNQLMRQIMAEPGVLSHAERQMVAAVAAGAQDCHY